MNVLLLGKPGSGKGTQAKLLSEKLGLRVVGVGDVLRALAKRDRELAEYLESGKLVPDDRLFEIVTDYLEDNSLRENLLFDGFPRSRVQYHAMRDWLEKFGSTFDFAVLLDIGEGELARRLAARGRTDDRKESVERRLSEFRQITTPMIEEMREEGILVSVNGGRDPRSIHEEILKHVRKKT